MRVYEHVGCTEYCKDFTVVLKMIDVIDKKQMYDRVITGNENASIDWNYSKSLFLMSFKCLFCVLLWIFYVYMSLKMLSGCFGTRSGSSW